MADVNDWNTTDANNNAAPPDGWPENTMQYSEVNDTGRQVQGAVRRMWGDINGSLAAGGVADAYTVTLNAPYTAYFAGMYFACEIMATNTGASTIDVNGIGAQAIVSRDGTALTGGELDSGGIYEFRYDGTNFQLMGTIGAALGTQQATLTNSNAIDLTDTDVALRVGASDPDTAQHVEVSPDEIQSKSDATTAAALSLNALGGNVLVGAQSGLGSLLAYDDGILRFQTSVNGLIFLRNNSNADPTVPDPFAAEFQFRSQDGNEYGFIGYESSTTMRMQNRAHGGAIEIRGETSAGAGYTAVSVNENNIQFSGQGGDESFRVLANTVRTFSDIVTATPPTTEAVTAGYDIVDQDTTDFLMRSGFFGSNDYEIINNMNGGRMVLRVEDSANVVRNVLLGDPDGAVSVYHPDDGVIVARTVGVASGGLEVDNQSTGAGFERVLTTSDLAGGLDQTLLEMTSNQNNSTTTLARITALELTGLADEDRYKFEGQVEFLVAATGPEFVINFTGGFDNLVFHWWANDVASSEITGAQSGAIGSGGGETGNDNPGRSTGAPRIVSFRGHFQKSGAGSVGIAFAQATANAQPVQALADGYIIYTDVT